MFNCITSLSGTKRRRKKSSFYTRKKKKANRLNNNKNDGGVGGGDDDDVPSMFTEFLLTIVYILPPLHSHIICLWGVTPTFYPFHLISPHFRPTSLERARERNVVISQERCRNFAKETLAMFPMPLVGFNQFFDPADNETIALTLDIVIFTAF